MTTSQDWSDAVRDQLDLHWDHQLRPRLEGLTDEEYFWEPVADCWNVRPRGISTAAVAAGVGPVTIDFAFPEPEPVPVTTIAWRLGHIIVGVLAMRSAGHFGRDHVDYQSWAYAPSADEALQQLDQEMSRWRAGLAGLSEQDLVQPAGEAEGGWHDHTMATLLLHINRELIHHGAEIALLRDLYAHHAH